MVTGKVTDVQQVITRTKGKAAEWETQEAIRKQATTSIQKANERNMAEVQAWQIKRPEKPLETIDNDPTWQVLQ